MTYDSETWLQIPCAPKYEINCRGAVRNIKSGHILSVYRRNRSNKTVALHINKKRHFFSISNLLWLAHGKKPRKRSTIAMPVIVSRDNERYYFDSGTQAAQFLARREHYTFSGVWYHLSKRREEIFGWRINYQR